MALEKITIATEEKQDKILQDINEIKNLIAYVDANSRLQIKAGKNNKQDNGRYLLIGVTDRNIRYVFDNVTATNTSGEQFNQYQMEKYTTDKIIEIDNKTFYLLKETFIITKYKIYLTASALMLKLD